MAQAVISLAAPNHNGIGAPAGATASCLPQRRGKARAISIFREGGWRGRPGAALPAPV